MAGVRCVEQRHRGGQSRSDVQECLIPPHQQDLAEQDHSPVVEQKQLLLFPALMRLYQLA